MKRLTVFQTDKGRYSVRPIDWEGIWDKQGRIQESGIHHIAIFEEKEEAEFFVKTKDMEEQGKLFILPCKIGDHIYINDIGIVMQYTVTGFSVGKLNDDNEDDEDDMPECNEIIIHYAHDSGVIEGEISAKYIGKTMFLTEDEAWKAVEIEERR